MENADTRGENESKTQEDADILAKTHRIFGNAEHGLTVAEIAQLLNLQPSSVRIYLRNDKRRIDLYCRLFEEDEAITERAVRIVEARRASLVQESYSLSTSPLVGVEKRT